MRNDKSLKALNEGADLSLSLLSLLPYKVIM